MVLASLLTLFFQSCLFLFFLFRNCGPKGQRQCQSVKDVSGIYVSVFLCGRLHQSSRNLSEIRRRAGHNKNKSRRAKDERMELCFHLPDLYTCEIMQPPEDASYSITYLLFNLLPTAREGFTKCFSGPEKSPICICDISKQTSRKFCVTNSFPFSFFFHFFFHFSFLHLRIRDIFYS